MTRPTRKADPRIERTTNAILLQLGTTDWTKGEGQVEAYRWLRRRLRAFEQAVLREAADRAMGAVPVRGKRGSAAYMESLRVGRAVYTAAIENRRKP